MSTAAAFLRPVLTVGGGDAVPASSVQQQGHGVCVCVSVSSPAVVCVSTLRQQLVLFGVAVHPAGNVTRACGVSV